MGEAAVAVFVVVMGEEVVGDVIVAVAGDDDVECVDDVEVTGDVLDGVEFVVVDGPQTPRPQN